MPRPVTEEQKRVFGADGCVKLGRFVEPEHIGRFLAGARVTMKSVDNPYKVIPSLHLADDRFRDFCWWSGFAGQVANLCEAKQLPLSMTEIFSKDLGAEEPINWHNDTSYYPFKSGLITTIWVALVDISKEMSAMRLVAGSYRRLRMFKPHLPSIAADIKENKSPAGGMRCWAAPRKVCSRGRVRCLGDVLGIFA